MARARWRRCLALNLALRLFARIVLLDLAAFFTLGLQSGGIGLFLAGIESEGQRLLPALFPPLKTMARPFLPHPPHRSRSLI